LDFIVTPCDKNLGLAVLERAVDIQRALSDHLLDREMYRQLQPQEETEIMNDTTDKVKKLISKLSERDIALKAEVIFLICASNKF